MSVWCMEAVCISESPLWEVPLYLSMLHYLQYSNVRIYHSGIYVVAASILIHMF